MLYLKVIVLQLGVPACCLVIELVGVFPKGEVGIVSEDYELVFSLS